MAQDYSRWPLPMHGSEAPEQLHDRVPHELDLGYGQSPAARQHLAPLQLAMSPLRNGQWVGRTAECRAVLLGCGLVYGLRWLSLG